MTMHANHQAIEAFITEALAKSVSAVTRTGYGQWSVQIANGRVHRGTARMDDTWFILAVPLRPRRAPSAERLWRMLLLNGEIEGAGKFALAHGGRSACLRAEISLADGEHVARRVTRTCDGLVAALDALGALSAAPAPAESPGDSEAQGEDLKRLCAAGGWEFTEAGGGGVAVQLETRVCPYYAMARPRGDGGVDLSVEVASGQDLSASCRHALAAMMLSACQVVRMARAAAREADGRTAVRFEVALDRPVGAGELSRGLAALSVSCELCGPEARALWNQDIADAYLSLSRSAKDGPGQKTSQKCRRLSKSASHP